LIVATRFAICPVSASRQSAILRRSAAIVAATWGRLRSSAAAAAV
jgi:hypothetical protein